MVTLKGRALTEKFSRQLEEFGIKPGIVFRNVDHGGLIKAALDARDGTLTDTGAIAVTTGRYTGRSPDDRFIVYDDTTRETVDWNKINHKFSSEAFGELLDKMKKHTSDRDLYVFDGFVGAAKSSRLPIRIINDHAWQSLFASCLFIRPTDEELERHEPEFTVLCLNNFKTVPQTHGTKSTVCILIDLTRKVVLIAGTKYAGEIKKSMFSVMNFLLPGRGIFPMHCSANTDRDNHTALFFGLSGTGKTTLSADSSRMLIGDDEHGWSDSGIFNFEGGCYAKCINLSKENEPQIWSAIRDGAVLENVVVDPNGKPDFDDSSLTENTRVAYPLDHIPGAVQPSVGGHPSVIIFLTADAKGVVPPVSRLSREGAMYHFMSGYTSKLAGTERGVKKPKSVFSECFGAPFMPRHAQTYAKMLAEKITRHNTKVYLINTGWSGGPYGTGKRIKLAYSRAMVTAALSGDLEKAEYRHDPIFNLDVPTSCPGVPDEILDPKNTWESRELYETQARRLAGKFTTNFAKFNGVAQEIVDAGPQS